MEEDLDAFLWLPPEFPLGELCEVAGILSNSGICVPGYIPPPAGLFEPKGFFYSSHIEQVEVVLLPDRNVASRIAQLAQGRSSGTDHQLQTAAAILAFCQCLDILIEPSIAFHELAHRSGNESAWSELGWFRAADNGDVHDLLQIALGRHNTVKQLYSPHNVERLNLAFPLKRWRRNYVVALKVVELEKLRMRPIDRFRALIDWMQTDFMFAGPAALLSAIYFAPNSPPRRRMFKRQNSKNRDAAIAGIRNAAWDMTYLSDFATRINEAQYNAERRRYLFATFDSNLRRIARILVANGREEVLSDSLESAVGQWWSPKGASLICLALEESLARVRSPDWKEKQAPYPNYIDCLIERGEELVRKAV